jgi:hypothetical protein
MFPFTLLDARASQKTMLSWLPREIFDELAQFYVHAATPPPPLNPGLGLRPRDSTSGGSREESEERKRRNMQLPKMFLDIGYGLGPAWWNQRTGTRYFETGIVLSHSSKRRLALYRWRRAVCPFCLNVVNGHDLVRTRPKAVQHCKRCHRKNLCGGKRKRV